FAPFVAGYKFKSGALAGSEGNIRNLPSVTVGLLTVASSLAIFLVVALGPFAIWFAASPVFRLDWHTWLSSMQSESERHPISTSNLKPFLIYFFMSAPLITVALPFAAWKEWRERGLTLSLTVAAIGLLATTMLFFNYSTTIN